MDVIGGCRRWCLGGQVEMDDLSRALGGRELPVETKQGKAGTRCR